MLLTKQQLTLIMLAFSLAVYFEISEGRAHIRHQHGGSHCSRCIPGWGVVSRCAKGRDTGCARCSRGTYSPHHSSQPCWICSRCGPGLYEARPCTSRADTVCDSCHRPAHDNLDYQKKCSTHNVFLAPEDARNTGEQSVLVNEAKESFDMDGRELILREDAEAEVLDEPRDVEREFDHRHSSKFKSLH